MAFGLPALNDRRFVIHCHSLPFSDQRERMTFCYAKAFDFFGLVFCSQILIFAIFVETRNPE